MIGKSLQSIADLFGRQAGQHDHRKFRAVSLHVDQYVKAIHVRHLQVEQQQVVRAALDQGQSGVAVGGLIYLIPLAAQDLRQGSPFNGRVVAKEQSKSGGINFHSATIGSFRLHTLNYAELESFPQYVNSSILVVDNSWIDKRFTAKLVLELGAYN